MSKKITKFGKMVLSIVVLVSLLAAASGKAEIIQSDRILYGESGNDWIEFSTDARGLLEDSYRFSRTFKLDSEGSYFTSVFLDPQYINMALRHTLNNLGLTDIPGYDVSGNYDITVSWEGAISITAGVQGDDNFKQKINSYEQSYTSNNINYDPDYLIEGTVGRVSSDSVNASFRNLNNITFVADELVGIDTITFDLFLNGITIESDAYTGTQPNIASSWSGDVTGAFDLAWDAPGNTSTPEPATLLILGLGLAGAGVVSARRRKK